jgi:elongation factor Ts
MAAFSAADVKTLRDRLGAGMLDSKNALVEADGDIEKAIEILRVKGLKGVEKRSGRATTAGLVTAKAGDGVATLIELASETDFVAKNERFIELAEKVLEAVAAAGATDVESAKAAPLGDTTVQAHIDDEAALLGEKVELRSVKQVRGEQFAIYLHKTSKDLPPQVGVVLGYAGDDAETARSVAQHIAVYDPKYATRQEVPAETVEHERQVLTEATRNEGKPEAALPKIVEGKLGGWYKRVPGGVLLEQPYARDDRQTVGQVLGDARVVRFAQVLIGQ